MSHYLWDGILQYELADLALQGLNAATVSCHLILVVELQAWFTVIKKLYTHFFT
jgi:hypothetical protein